MKESFKLEKCELGNSIDEEELGKVPHSWTKDKQTT